MLKLRNIGIENNISSFEETKAVGTLLDVKIGIIRDDYDPERHGTKISFKNSENSLFQTKSGKLVPEWYLETANLLIYSYKNVFKEYAFNMECFRVADPVCKRYGAMNRKFFRDSLSQLFADIRMALKRHVTQSDIVARSVSRVLFSALACDCNKTDIMEKGLGTLYDVKHKADFDGASMLFVSDSIYAGAAFVEVTPFCQVPCAVSENGELDFSGIFDWDEYECENKKFIFLLH